MDALLSGEREGPAPRGHLQQVDATVLRVVTYWLDREHWGRGHASAALALVLSRAGRPVVARVVADNDASCRVLTKAGFRAVGTDRDFAQGRQAEVEEIMLRLD